MELSSSLLIVVIVVLGILALKEFVETMNQEQEAAMQREKNKETIKELKEEMKESKRKQEETKDYLTMTNLRIGLGSVALIVLLVLFVTRTDTGRNLRGYMPTLTLPISDTIGSYTGKVSTWLGGNAGQGPDGKNNGNNTNSVGPQSSGNNTQNPVVVLDDTNVFLLQTRGSSKTI
jgi:hypothetical protein